MDESVLVSKLLVEKLNHKQDKNFILSKAFLGHQSPFQARNKVYIDCVLINNVKEGAIAVFFLDCLQNCHYRQILSGFDLGPTEPRAETM